MKNGRPEGASQPASVVNRPNNFEVSPTPALAGGDYRVEINRLTSATGTNLGKDGKKAMKKTSAS